MFLHSIYLKLKYSLPTKLIEFWDWVWYYRKCKIKYEIYDYGDTYMATASNREITVVNCYGSTPELAKEIATMKLRRSIE